MKRVFVLVALIVAGAALVAARSVLADEKGHSGHAEGHKEGAAAEATFTGEVVDLTCYVTHPGGEGAGLAHATCAKTCLEKGLPAGLLVGDVLYVLVMKDHEAPAKSLAAHAGGTVTVKGTASEVGGTHVLAVSQVTPASGGAKK